MPVLGRARGGGTVGRRGVLLGLLGAGSARAFAAEPIILVLEDGTLRLADGTGVRLAGIVVAEPLHPAVLSMLRDLLRPDAKVELGRHAWDRWGRMVADLRIGGVDPALALVAAGLAFAAPAGDGRPEAARLLRAEAEARDARRGIWRGGSPIQQAERIVAAAGAFVIVEGTALAVDRTSDRVYVNFGADQRRDFTLRAASAMARRWQRQGLDLMALAGRRVRARGWLMQAGGPMIELDSMEQVEILS